MGRLAGGWLAQGPQETEGGRGGCAAGQAGRQAWRPAAPPPCPASSSFPKPPLASLPRRPSPCLIPTDPFMHSLAMFSGYFQPARHWKIREKLAAVSAVQELRVLCTRLAL